MSWTTEVTFGKPDVWLSLWGNMISSIIGGVFSGGLTLAGVLLTLKHQEKREFLRNYSSKIAKLDEILKDIVTFKEYLKDDFTKIDKVDDLREKIQMKLSNLPHLIALSIDINHHLYTEIKFKYAMQLEVLRNECKCYVLFDSPNLSSTINDTEKELSLLILDITTEQKNLSDEYKKYNRM